MRYIIFMRFPKKLYFYAATLKSNIYITVQQFGGNL